MPEQFIIQVTCKNQRNEFPVTIVRLGYSYQLHVYVNEQSLVFEPDENREFRLVKMPWQNEDDLKKADTRLIQSIIETLNKIYTEL